MKIIILGAGQVGSTLAAHLATEVNDITIIDIDDERLRNVQEHLDILTLSGHGAYPQILKKSGAEEAHMLIAVTSSDETNLVACQIAHTLFQIPTKIARVRSLEYLEHAALFGSGSSSGSAFPVDVLISPEQLVTHAIRRLIEYPNALQVVDFADQKVQLVALKVSSKASVLVGLPLKQLPQYMPYIDTRIVAIVRNKKLIVPTGSTCMEEHDEVFFIAAREHVRHIMNELTSVQPNRRIIIAGGGHVGTRLATSLENEFQVKVIEHNREHAEHLAAQLKKSIVLIGDCADKELLLNENIEDTDVFCAVTNRDEANIMSSILAKHLGARQVMALVNRSSFLEVVENGDIDIVISPQEVTIGSLLTHVRRGHVVNVHSIRRGAAEAIEIVVHGTQESSNVIGRNIHEISLPAGVMIGAVVRGNKTLMGHKDVRIEANDHVILFLGDKTKIRAVERLFQEEDWA